MIRIAVDALGITRDEAVAPCLAEDFDDRLQPAALVPLGAAETNELLLPPADAEAKDQAAVRQDVNGRGVLGKVKGIEQRGEEDAGPKRDALGSCSDRCQHGQLRWHVPVIDEVVLAGPHRLESDPLGFDRQLDDLAVDLDIGALVVRVVLRREQPVAEVHSSGRASGRGPRVVVGRIGIVEALLDLALGLRGLGSRATDRLAHGLAPLGERLGSAQDDDDPEDDDENDDDVDRHGVMVAPPGRGQARLWCADAAGVRAALDLL
jgi:hypothetical protein